MRGETNENRNQIIRLSKNRLWTGRSRKHPFMDVGQFLFNCLLFRCCRPCSGNYFSDYAGCAYLAGSLRSAVRRHCRKYKEQMGALPSLYPVWSSTLALFNCLTFLNLDISNGAKTFWCVITYIACCTAYSFANGAVTCVVNSITSINAERVSANAYKGAIGSIFSMIVSAVTMPMLLYFGGGNTNSSTGYFLTALVFSIASLPCFFLCFKATREVITGGTKETGEKRKILSS